MRKDVGKFVGYRIGVNRHRNCAEHLCRHHGPIKLRSVAADNGYCFTAFDTQAVQAGGIGAHEVEDLAPGPGLPDAEILVPHGRPRPVQMGVPHKQLRKCLSQPGDVRRHSLFLPCGHAYRRGFQPLAVSYGRSCCLDMKTPPEGGQVSDECKLVVVGGEAIPPLEEGLSHPCGIAPEVLPLPPWPRPDAAV